MYTLEQSLRVKGSAGDPLPVVWPSIPTFLRGQLVLVCAAPGIGKSALVLSYALKSRVPTLYFSADSDAYTQLSRSVSILTGWPMERSTRMVRDEELNGATDLIRTVPIRMEYSAVLTTDRIKTVLDAYDEVYGDFPALVVVDNVTNVTTGGERNDEDPFAGLEVLMEFLHERSRATGACVIGLHHVTGKYNDGDIPIPLGGVKGQIARVPEVILTLHKGIGNTMNVSTVKNRAGKADASGANYVQLLFDGTTMQIRDRSSSNG